jgi:hypothetical protein
MPISTLSDKEQRGRVVLEGAEAEAVNKLFRPTPETLERLRQQEEGWAIAALQCRNILVD